MKVIITADDFGYSDDTVDATTSLIEAGIVTGASIMLTMPASRRALEFAQSRTGFTFGVHLIWTSPGGGQTTAARPSSNRLKLQLLLGHSCLSTMKIEARSQIEYVRSCGIPVQYVDSHSHVHKIPAVRNMLSELLPQLSIARLRNVQDIYLKRRPLSPTYLLGNGWRSELMRKFVSTDHFYMPASDVRTGWAARLARLDLNGVLEVGVHPGAQDGWRSKERDEVIVFAKMLKEQGHQLVSWPEVYPQ